MLAPLATLTAPERPLWNRLFELCEGTLARIEEARIQGRRVDLPALHAALVKALASHGFDMEALRERYAVRFRDNAKDTEALNFYAALSLLRDDPDGAHLLYRQSLALHPRQPDALYNLGCVAQALRRIDEAIDAFRRLLALAPHYAQGYVRLGKCLYYKGDIAAAEQVIAAALKAKPDFGDALKVLMSCQLAGGKTAEMAATCRRALGFFPGGGDFFYFLTQAERLSPDAPETREAEAHFDDPATDDENRRFFGFGLARVYDGTDPGRAIAYLNTVNALAAKDAPYDVARVERSFAALHAIFAAPSSPLPWEPEPLGFTPIFIVGMPRSGTSLVEQILSGHSAIHAAGELDYLQYVAYVELARATGKIYPEGVPLALAAGSELLARLRRAYAERLRAHGPDARFITDKLPGNFLFIGLIRLLFPEAKIVHCTRDPAATCFSIYRQQFVGRHNYANNLENLGHCHRHYQALMRHWHRVYPGAMLDVSYEALIADFPAQALRLVEGCGLPWEEACLEFHKNRHPVRTASATQVTQPIYASAREDWKRYERYLQPLLCALEPSRSDENSQSAR